VLGDRRERPPCVLGRRDVAVVEVEGGAVVDQPQPSVPDEQVRVPRGAVDVRDERVEPDDLGRAVRVGVRVGRGRERQRARQEVHAQVRSRARQQEVLDLRVGLGAPDRRVELDDRQLGHGQAERRASSPATTSATSAFRPCPAPVNLST
jgi:hypothetical protein